MTNPNQSITVPYTSSLIVSIVETTTGNQLFSASAVASASASASNYPLALSIASKLAAETVIQHGRKLIREHLANKSKKLELVKTESSCTDTCTSEYTLNATYTVLNTVNDVKYPDYCYNEYTYSYKETCVDSSTTYLDLTCYCCSSTNSSTELANCNAAITTNLCGDTACGCPTNCTC